MANKTTEFYHLTNHFMDSMHGHFTSKIDHYIHFNLDWPVLPSVVVLHQSDMELEGSWHTCYASAVYAAVTCQRQNGCKDQAGFWHIGFVQIILHCI